MSSHYITWYTAAADMLRVPSSMGTLSLSLLHVGAFEAHITTVPNVACKVNCLGVKGLDIFWEGLDCSIDNSCEAQLLTCSGLYHVLFLIRLCVFMSSFI